MYTRKNQLKKRMRNVLARRPALPEITGQSAASSLRPELRLISDQRSNLVGSDGTKNRFSLRRKLNLVRTGGRNWVHSVGTKFKLTIVGTFSIEGSTSPFAVFIGCCASQFFTSRTQILLHSQYITHFLHKLMYADSVIE